MAAAPLPSRVLILLALLSGTSGVSAAQELTLAPQQPIVQADASLRTQGWEPAKDLDPEPMDRQRAGNHLQSLSACSANGESRPWPSLPFLARPTTAWCCSGFSGDDAPRLNEQPCLKTTSVRLG